MLYLSLFWKKGEDKQKETGFGPFKNIPRYSLCLVSKVITRRVGKNYTGLKYVSHWAVVLAQFTGHSLPITDDSGSHLVVGKFY